MKLDSYTLTIRTQNVLAAAFPDLTAPEVRALPEEKILRARNAGWRVVHELRSVGLRPGTCPTTPGCIHLEEGHPPACETFSQRYLGAPRPPREPHRVVVTAIRDYVRRHQLELASATTADGTQRKRLYRHGPAMYMVARRYVTGREPEVVVWSGRSLDEAVRRYNGLG